MLQGARARHACHVRLTGEDKDLERLGLGPGECTKRACESEKSDECGVDFHVSETWRRFSSAMPDNDFGMGMALEKRRHDWITSRV